ncbi:MAG: bifunctional ornithine acetyltransferase/N-acetylglutamate synthase, partial [Gammaproteobacteria bacterium]|nr:bifunctional ornithine acetyltransferase/N-acetylglutamate synthase [Gammaproteobacteria bacterium]
MAVGLQPPTALFPVKGIRLAATHSGIKSDPALKDLTLVEVQAGASLAAVFTQSHFSAAPVKLCQQHLSSAPAARYLLINSGNANAGTGDAGMRAAIECCESVAAATGVAVNQVLPFSTGVIAEPLPVERIKQALPGLVAQLDADAWLDAAQGIMTTDTLPKAVSTRISIDNQPVAITGIAKGSGMIKP